MGEKFQEALKKQFLINNNSAARDLIRLARKSDKQTACCTDMQQLVSSCPLGNKQLTLY